MKSKIPAVLCLLVLLAVSCGGTTPSSGKPVNDPSAPYDASVVPEKDQPAFPKLGTTWIVDPANACRFSPEAVSFANGLFEGLKRDHIAEVAVVCQKGVKDNGPYDNGKIWAMNWGNWARIGDKKDQRGVVWLIIPDAPAGKDRVIIEKSMWAADYSVFEYWDDMTMAGGYAAYGKFDDVLELIARQTDENLRLHIRP